MKKIIMFTLLAIGFATVSCDKETNNQVSGEQTTYKAAGFGVQFWIGKGLGCVNVRGDCHEDIVINGLNKIIDFLYDNGNDETIDPSKIKPNYEVLVEYIDNLYLDDVINGNLNMTIKYEKGLNAYYMIFTDTETDKIVYVYPFVCKK